MIYMASIFDATYLHYGSDIIYYLFFTFFARQKLEI